MYFSLFTLFLLVYFWCFLTDIKCMSEEHMNTEVNIRACIIQHFINLFVYFWACILLGMVLYRTQKRVKCLDVG